METHRMTTMPVVGLDVGYGNLKVAYGGSDVPQVVVLPGGAGPYDSLNRKASVSGGLPSSVLADGIHVSVPWPRGTKGPKVFDMVAGVDRTRLPTVPVTKHDRFPETPEYMALYYAALTVVAGANPSGFLEVNTLITGLPVAQSLDQKERSALRDRLAGTYHPTRELTVRVSNVYVTAQPNGGFWDASYQLRDPRFQRAITEGRVLVLDPGYFSLDWALFDHGYLSRPASGSNNLAMHRLYMHVQRRFQSRYDEQIKISTIDGALRSGRRTVLWQGADLDLAPMLAEAADDLADDVITELRNSSQYDSEKIDLVVMVGGGSDLYAPVARRVFPHSLITITPQPVAANARGFWYAGWARGDQHAE